MLKRKTPEVPIQVRCFQSHVLTVARLLSYPSPDDLFTVQEISVQMRDLSKPPTEEPMRDLSEPPTEEPCDLWDAIIALSPPLDRLFGVADTAQATHQTDAMLRMCTPLMIEVICNLVKLDPLCADVDALLHTTPTADGGTRVHAPDCSDRRREFLVLRSFLAAFICLYADLLKQAAADRTDISVFSACYNLLCWFILHPHLSEPFFMGSELHPPLTELSPLTLVTRQLIRASNPFLLMALRGIASLHALCPTVHLDLMAPVLTSHVEELIVMPAQRLGNLMGLSMMARVLPVFLQATGIFPAIGHAVQRIVEEPDFAYPSFLHVSAMLSILTGLAHHTHVRCGLDQSHIGNKIVFGVLAVECRMRAHAPAEFARKFSLVPAVSAFLRQTKRKLHLAPNAALHMLGAAERSRLSAIEQAVIAEVAPIMRVPEIVPAPAWLDAAVHRALARVCSDMDIVTATRTYHCHKMHVLHHSSMLYHRYAVFAATPLLLADCNDMALELVLEWMYSGFVVHMARETAYVPSSEPELTLVPRTAFALHIDTADALTLLSVAVYLGVESLVCCLTDALTHPATDAELLREFAYDNPSLPQSVQILHTLYGKAFAATCTDRVTAAATILYAESQCLFRDDAGPWADADAVGLYGDVLAHT